jgi:plastocyanin
MQPWLALLVLHLLHPPAGSPTGTLSGTVRCPAGQKLPEIVVYLESPDPSRPIDVPSDQPEISQKGAQFSPPLLVICVGQTVVFKNDEDRSVEHNVFSRSPVKLFDLGLFNPPEARKVTFDKPGAVRLFCSIHRYMDGTIYVCPSPYFATVDATGAYRIQNLPPGRWLLKTWQKKARFDEQSVEIDVEPGKPLVANLEMSRK